MFVIVSIFGLRCTFLHHGSDDRIIRIPICVLDAFTVGLG